MKCHQSRAISEIVAILLIITLTLVAAGVLYVVVFNNFGRLSNTENAQIQASLLMVTSTTADASVNIYNAGHSPISSVTVSGNTGCTLSGPTTPIASGASGTMTATGCTAAVGTPQIWTFSVTFTNGPVVYTVSIIPHY